MGEAHLRLAGPLALGLLALACHDPERPSEAGPVAALAPTPTVELVGCEERRAGPSCEVVPEKTTLTLWVDGATLKTLRAAVDEAPLTPNEAAEVQGGLRIRVQPPPGLLSVSLAGHEPYTLKLTPSTADPRLAEVERLRHAGDLDASDRLLDEVVATSTVPGAWGQRARNLMARGRLEEARAAFEQSIRRAEADGRGGAWVSDQAALAYLHVAHGFQLGRARALLDRLEAEGKRDTWAALRRDYYGAALAVRERDARSGLLHVRRALARSERLGRDSDVTDMRQYRLLLLRLTGRWKELRGEVDALRPMVGGRSSACRRAQLHTNLGWVTLLGRRHAPELSWPDPTEDLERSVALYRTECPRPLRLLNAEINAGWASLFAGALEGAEARLAAARGLGPRLEDVTSRLDLDHLAAELLARRGEHRRAVRAFAALARSAASAKALDVVWQAHFGRGRALEARGDLAAAAAAYQESQNTLHVWARRVPLGEGRDTLLETREGSARALVDALSRLGRAEAAIAAIRRSRRGSATRARQPFDLGIGSSREELERLRAAVRSARSALDDALLRAWALPAEAVGAARRDNERRVERARAALDRLLSKVAPPTLPDLVVGPQDALLFAHPVDDGMVVWVRTRGGTIAVRTSVDAVGLAAVGAHLEGAARARVYAHPSLLSLPWDRTPVEGRPLYERAALIFHADLGPPEASGSTEGVSGLVLADPAGDLPRARVEAEVVRDLWDQVGWRSARLPPAPSVGTVRAALERAPFVFHYSGHGVRAGLDGLEGGIPLGTDRRFTVVDVLALERAPRRVVLAACDLGARDSTAFSMAQAFLHEGTEAVVAAVRPVDDRETSRWVEAFYRDLVTAPAEVRGSSSGWAEALRATRAELAKARPAIDSSAFRIWLRE